MGSLDPCDSKKEILGVYVSVGGDVQTGEQGPNIQNKVSLAN